MARAAGATARVVRDAFSNAARHPEKFVCAGVLAAGLMYLSGVDEHKREPAEKPDKPVSELRTNEGCRTTQSRPGTINNMWISGKCILKAGDEIFRTWSKFDDKRPLIWHLDGIDGRGITISHRFKGVKTPDVSDYHGMVLVPWERPSERVEYGKTTGIRLERGRMSRFDRNAFTINAEKGEMPGTVMAKISSPMIENTASYAYYLRMNSPAFCTRWRNSGL